MALEFVAEVIKAHLREPIHAVQSTDNDFIETRDIFSCLSRLQLEALIEQVPEDMPLNDRELIAGQIFLQGRRDCFKLRHKIPLQVKRKAIARIIPLGRLACLSRAELEDFAKYR